jgi:selenocysteine-specific elongation factor
MSATCTADALRLMIDALSKTSLHAPVAPFDWSKQYLYQDELYGLEGRPINSSSSTPAAAAGGEDQQRHFGPQWVLLKFDQPVTAPEVRPAQRVMSLRAHSTSAC